MIFDGRNRIHCGPRARLGITVSAAAALFRETHAGASQAITGDAIESSVVTARSAPCFPRTGTQASPRISGCIQATRADEGFELVRTLHIDLTLEQTRLFADLKKSTKNQVNRADKHDELTYIAIAQPADEDIIAFRDFYNGFARVKGTTLCRRYQVETLRLLARQSGLVMTRVMNAAGRAQCYHVYVADGALCCFIRIAFRSVATRSPQALARANRCSRNAHPVFKQRGKRSTTSRPHGRT